MSADLIPPTPPEPEIESPRWSANTKIFVAVIVLALVIALTLRFTGIIRLLTIAAIVAYLINPVVAFIDSRTRFNRSVAIAAVYLSLVVVVVGGAVVLGIAAFSEIVAFVNRVPDLILDLVDLIRGWVERTEPIRFGPFAFSPADFDWDTIVDQLLGYVEPTVSRSGRILTGFATRTVTFLSQTFLIVIISVYLTAEIPQLGGYVVNFARTPGYQRDAERLIGYTKLVWSSYLRGQVILGLIIGVFTSVGLAVAGVQYSLALGIMAGLLEFVPNLGPIVSTIVAVVVALFQPENMWGLTNVQLALVTLAIMVVIQQLENNLLVPRIVGNALNLHPLLVLLGVLMGATLAGILGAILAAPLLASVKLIGTYVWRKMFDLPPFAEDMPLPEPVLLASEEEE